MAAAGDADADILALKNRLPIDPLDKKAVGPLFLRVTFGLRLNFTDAADEATKGAFSVLIKLDTDKFPGAVANLVALAEAGRYTGLGLHEWAADNIRLGDFWTQANEPAESREACIGVNGASAQGGMFYAESAPTLPVAGDVCLFSMERDEQFERSTYGFKDWLYHSQFFITLCNKSPHPLGRGWGVYPVIGRLLPDTVDPASWRALSAMTDSRLVLREQRIPLHQLVVLRTQVFTSEEDALASPDALDGEADLSLPGALDKVFFDKDVALLTSATRCVAARVKSSGAATLSRDEAFVFLRSCARLPLALSGPDDPVAEEIRAAVRVLNEYWLGRALVPLCYKMDIPVPDGSEHSPLEAVAALRKHPKAQTAEVRAYVRGLT